MVVRSGVWPIMPLFVSPFGGKMNLSQLNQESSKMLKEIVEKTIDEKLTLLENWGKYEYPEVVYLTMKARCFNLITNFKGNRFEEFINRYLRLK